MRRNPPWTDKILAAHWAALESRVGASWMPVASMEDPKQVKLAKDIETREKNLASLRAQQADRQSMGQVDAWLDQRVAETQADLVTMRPQLAKMMKRKPRQYGYREYGCGHYGCVMPTSTPGVVIKVTTDQTEASFVAAYLSMPKGQRPVGIIPYHRIIAIRSSSHKGRPVFVLWRDEAQHLGADAIRNWISTGARDFERDYYIKSFSKVKHLIGNCLDAAREVRLRVHNKSDAKEVLAQGVKGMNDAWERGIPPGKGAPRSRAVAWFLSVFDQNAMEMTSEPMGNYIGQGMHECLEAGILLADVHLNNIGMPSGPLADEIGMTPIITDPGHAIALDDRYAGVTMEEL